MTDADLMLSCETNFLGVQKGRTDNHAPRAAMSDEPRETGKAAVLKVKRFEEQAHAKVRCF